MKNQEVVRSSNGIIAGVCQGVAEKIDVSPNLVRVAWVVFVILGFSGVFVYILLAICLPSQKNIKAHYQKKFLGTSLMLAKKYDWDLGLTRAAIVALSFISLGLTILIYIALAFILESELRKNQDIIDQ